jgi:DNA-binding transcriptional MerR regulator
MVLFDTLWGNPTVKAGHRKGPSMLIGELARLSGMSKDGIRHYEEFGIVRSVPRQAGSRWYRDYGESELDRIEKARQAQQLGLPLKEVGPLLDLYVEREPTTAETVSFLNDRLAIVREKIAALREVEDFIVRKLARYALTQA